MPLLIADSLFGFLIADSLCDVVSERPRLRAGRRDVLRSTGSVTSGCCVLCVNQALSRLCLEWLDCATAGHRAPHWLRITACWTSTRAPAPHFASLLADGPRLLFTTPTEAKATKRMESEKKITAFLRPDRGVARCVSALSRITYLAW